MSYAFQKKIKTVIVFVVGLLLSPNHFDIFQNRSDEFSMVFEYSEAIPEIHKFLKIFINF